MWTVVCRSALPRGVEKRKIPTLLTLLYKVRTEYEYGSLYRRRASPPHPKMILRILATDWGLLNLSVHYIYRPPMS